MKRQKNQLKKLKKQKRKKKSLNFYQTLNYAKDSYSLFGKVSNSHGYKGDFKISSFNSYSKISEIKFIFIKINGCQIPFRALNLFKR